MRAKHFHPPPLQSFIGLIAPQVMTRVTMRRRGYEAVLSFDYDRYLVRAVKTLDRRRYDPMTKEWTIPIHYYADALATLEAVGAEVEMDKELADMHERAVVPPEARGHPPGEVNPALEGRQGRHLSQEALAGPVPTMSRCAGRPDMARRRYSVPLCGTNRPTNRTRDSSSGIPCRARMSPGGTSG